MLVIKDKKNFSRFFAEKGETKEKDAKVLTGKEYALLEILMENKNKLVEYEKLMTEVWDGNNFKNRRSMNVYCSKLRDFLNDFPIEILCISRKGIILNINE